MRYAMICAAATAMFTLAACDEKVVENTIIGGALGCAAGEVLVSDKCVEGALLGGTVGAVTAQ